MVQCPIEMVPALCKMILIPLLEALFPPPGKKTDSIKATSLESTQKKVLNYTWTNVQYANDYPDCEKFLHSMYLTHRSRS